MSRRLRFPRELRESEGRLHYGVRVEAQMYGEWVAATVQGGIVDALPGEEERIRLVDDEGSQFYGYPSTVRVPQA